MPCTQSGYPLHFAFIKQILDSSLSILICSHINLFSDSALWVSLLSHGQCVLSPQITASVGSSLDIIISYIKYLCFLGKERKCVWEHGTHSFMLLRS